MSKTTLDEILYRFAVDTHESKPGQDETPNFDKAKQALIDWHNKQVEEVLDRLESTAAYGTDIEEYAEDVLSAIEAERNKLKESSNDKDR